MIFFMTTPHHPDQNQPCKTKQNTLLSSAIHRNPTDDPDPAMVLQTQSHDVSSEKKVGSPYLLSCTCLSDLFGPRILSLLSSFIGCIPQNVQRSSIIPGPLLLV